MLSQIDKQIVRAWHRHLIAPRLAKLVGGRQDQSGPRIAVVGNCQSYGVAYAMKLLDPAARVDHFSAIGKSFTTVELFAKTMETYDHVFSHEFPPGHLRKGGVEELRRRFSRLTIFPAVTFAAFQPDLVYLLDATRGQNPLNGPLRPYHSALAVFAYRIGLSLEQANALFNRNVYETVGYFDVWNSAAQEFLTYANNFGLDLSTDFTNWSRRGVFMYSIVHPKPFVLGDLARRLFAKAGLAIHNENINDYAIDDLARSEIFPVYPEIAEFYGVRGAYLFKRGNFHISDGVGEFLSLPQYLCGCYAVYKKARPEQIAHPRIDAWLADEELSKRLVGLAQENLSRGLTPVL